MFYIGKLSGITAAFLFANALCNFATPFGGLRAAELNGYDFYPATAGAKPYAGEFGKLPTGAKPFEVELPRKTGGAVVNAADFGLDEKIENAATIINHALEHCKKIGAVKLVIPKGTYKCFDAVSIKLDGFKDFTFDASGSTFIYYSESVKSAQSQWSKNRSQSNSDIEISNCSRVKICNIKLDWDWSRDPLASFAKIVGKNIDGEKSTVDFQFYQYDKYPKYGKHTTISTCFPFGKDLSEFAPLLRGFYFPDPAPITLGEGFAGAKTEWISPNTLRVYLGGYIKGKSGDKTEYRQFSELDESYVYQIAHYYYDKNGILMESNENLTLENVDIHSCRGHALHVDGKQKYWQYINVKIAPTADPRRAITATGDHHHVANSHGFMKLINCEFSLGHDDGGNFHDRSFAMKKTSARTLESANIRGLSYFDVVVGDEISLRNADYSETHWTGKIVSIGESTIEFDRDLPNPTGKVFVCFNKRFDTRNIIINGCNFHRHGCRGLLILAKDITIENSNFEIGQYGALKLETGYTFRDWCEGTGVDNVVVRNCKFKKENIRGVSTQGFMRDILLSGYIETDPSEIQPATPVIANVLFENNTFAETCGLVAIISASDNVVFRNNRIENYCEFADSFSSKYAWYRKQMWYRGGFFVRDSRNVKIVNNVFVKSQFMPNAGVFVKKGSVSNCVFEGNSVSE